MGIVRNALQRLGLRSWQSSMVYPIPSRRALYFAVPKVGCTTWLRICCQDQGVDLDGIPGEAWFDAVPSLSAGQVAEYPDWKRFAFVRNPWDRLVSCYLSKVKPSADVQVPGFTEGVEDGLLRFGVFRAGMSFVEFASRVVEIDDWEADNHFRSQHWFLQHRRRPIPGMEIRAFEGAPAVFAEVLRSLDLPADDVPHAKKSHGRSPYQSYYDSRELIERVGRRYAEDVRLFGYAFDPERAEPAADPRFVARGDGG